MYWILTHSETLLSCVRCSHTRRLCCRVLDAHTLGGFSAGSLHGVILVDDPSVLSVLVTT